MAFNGFPAYAPMYYTPQYQQPSQQQQGNSIIWVQGEAGAKSYLVAPNSTVQLWDSEAQVIYLKSADASGMPSIKILDYTIRNQQPVNGPTGPAANAPAYVTKAELDALQSQIDALKAQMKGASLNE